MKQTRLLILSFVMLLPLMSEAGQVKTLTLKNGLDIVMMPDASSPLISCLVVVRIGSSYETQEFAGSTHLLEHMLFRGTTTRTQGEIYDALDLMGAYHNAQTTETSTNFILVVPKERALEAMEIQADMILHSIIPTDTFEVEKGRVIAEIQQSLARPSYPAEVAHLAKLYGSTSYAAPTLGSVEIVSGLKHKNVVKFYQDWYTPNNMTLALRGDLTFIQMEKLADIVYGKEPSRKLPKHPINHPEGLETASANRLHFSYGDVNSGTIHLSFPAPRFDEQDYPAFSALQLFLDEELDRALRAAMPPAITYVYSNLTTDVNFSVLDVTVGLMPQADAGEVAKTVLQTIRSMPGLKKSTEEIHKKLKASHLEELFFSEQVQYGTFLLAPKLALAPYGFWEQVRSGEESVDSIVFSNVAKKWFTSPVWLGTAYLPHSEVEITQPMEFPELSPGSRFVFDKKRAEKEQTAAFQRFSDPKWSVTPLQTPEVEARTAGKTRKIEVETLANGLVIITRQVEGAPVSGIHVVAKNRALWEGEKRRGWVDVLHRNLLYGDSRRIKEELAEQMTDIGMSMATVDDPRVPMDDYRTTSDYSFIRIEALADRWQQALELLAELLSYDQIRPEDIEKAQSELKGIVQGENRLPGMAKMELSKRLYGDTSFSSSIYGDGSCLDSITVMSLMDFRRDYFAPENLILSILTPADHEEVLTVTNSLFGKMSPRNHTQPNQAHPVSSPGEVEIKGKGNQGCLACGFLIQPLPNDQLAPLLIANGMISDLIYRDLGEKKGWAYGAGSSLVMKNGWGAWQSTMGLPVEHLVESKEAVFNHLKRIAEGDFDNHRLEVAKQSLIGSILRRYSSRINLAMVLGVDEFYFNDPRFTWKLINQLKAATLNEVQLAAREYFLDPENVVVVYGKPEEEETKEGKRTSPTGMGGGMMR